MTTIAEKLTTIADNQVKVFEAGKASGGADDFWDAYQDYGNRTNYDCAFSGVGWNNETFKPKYTIKPKSGYMLFARSNITNLNRDDIDLYTQFRGGQYLCHNNQIAEEIGVIFATDTLNSAFQNATALKTIKEIIIPNDVKNTTYFGNLFNNTPNLENVTFSGGSITQSINMRWSTKLTNASLKSLLTALIKDASIATGLTCTLPTKLEATIQSDTELKNLYDYSMFYGWKFVFSN